VLTPLDVHQKEFRRAFRGYSEIEVDEFLDEIVRELEGLLKENTAYKEQLAAAGEELRHYKNIEETLQNTLVVAQEAAESLRANAKKEADVILMEARANADRLMKESQERVREVMQELESLKRERTAFLAKCKAFARTYLELLEREEASDDNKPKTAPGDIG